MCRCWVCGAVDSIASVCGCVRVSMLFCGVRGEGEGFERAGQVSARYVSAPHNKS